jgi:hypothetical protein
MESRGRATRTNVRYTIDKERRLILTTAEGRVTFDDIKDHQDRLLVDPGFDESLDQMIDTTAVTKIDLSVRDARVLGERRIVSPESRRAFVATEPAWKKPAAGDVQRVNGNSM